MIMKFTLKQFIVPKFKKRLSFMLPSVLLMGVFLSILIEIGWGTDPASFMNLNIAYALNFSLGNTQVIVYLIFFIFTFLFGSHLIGFGTLANMFLIGYMADFCKFLWKKSGFHSFLVQSEFLIRLPIFCIALICFVIFASIYMNSKMGMAPYDATPKILSDFLPKFPFVIIRILFDFSAIGIGLIASLFSGEIQGSIIGSIAMSILLGPIISFVGKKLEKIL